MGENEIYKALGMTPPEPAPGPEAGREELKSDSFSAWAAESGLSAKPVTGGPTGEPAGNPLDEQPEGEVTPETEPEEGRGEGTAEPFKRESEGELEPSRNPARGEAERTQQEAIQRAVSEAVARERERAGEEWRQFFARAGLKNTATGAAIASKEEFEDWYRSYETARLERELKEGKLTPESLQRVAERAVAERMEQRRPEPPQKLEVTQADIDRELAEIHRMDSSVNGLEDILKLETGPAFRDAVRRGHSFLDAFKLANFDRLQQQRQAEAAHRAARAARNNAASKEHLKASTSKGSGSTPVPGDVMEMYRMMMPGASEAEIMAHYNKVLKEMRS